MTLTKAQANARMLEMIGWKRDKNGSCSWYGPNYGDWSEKAPDLTCEENLHLMVRAASTIGSIGSYWSSQDKTWNAAIYPDPNDGQQGKHAELTQALFSAVCLAQGWEIEEEK